MTNIPKVVVSDQKDEIRFDLQATYSYVNRHAVNESPYPNWSKLGVKETEIMENRVGLRYIMTDVSIKGRYRVRKYANFNVFHREGHTRVTSRLKVNSQSSA